MKPTEQTSPDDHTRVWRPARIDGVEIGVKRSPIALRFVPSLVFDYRFVINGHGRGRFRFGSETYRFDDVRNAVFLQHPGEVFEGCVDGPSGGSGACIGLSPEFMARWNGHDRRQPAGHPRFRRMLPGEREGQRLAGLIRVALRSFCQPTPVLEQQTAVLALLEAATQCSIVAPATTSITSTAPVGHRAVAIARSYLHDLPALDHSMDDLARVTGLHPRYLIRAFRQQTGLTPHKYLTGIRVQRAKELLRTDRPLGMIATDLGFADQAHFTRVFRAHVQVPPGTFRRLSRTGFLPER